MRCRRAPDRPGSPAGCRIVKSGLKPSSSSCRRPQEHVAGEQVVPGGLGDDRARRCGAPDRRRPSSRGRTGRGAGRRPACGCRGRGNARARSACWSCPSRCGPCISRSSTKNLSLGERPVCTPVAPRRRRSAQRPRRGGSLPRRARDRQVRMNGGPGGHTRGRRGRSRAALTCISSSQAHLRAPRSPAARVRPTVRMLANG